MGKKETEGWWRRRRKEMERSVRRKSATSCWREAGEAGGGKRPSWPKKREGGREEGENRVSEDHSNINVPGPEKRSGDIP